MFTINQDVIVVKRHQRPELATITHVTKTGQFKTDVTGEKRYRVLYSGLRCQCIGKHGYMSAEEIDVHPHSSDKMAELIADFERGEAEAKEARERRDAKRAANQRLHEEQLEIVRVMFPWAMIARSNTLPDGSRVYQFTLENTNGTNGDWVWLLIVCSDAEVSDWNGETIGKKPVVRASATYKRAGRDGFPSMGSTDYDTEKAAIYDALQYAQFKVY